MIDDVVKMPQSHSYANSSFNAFLVLITDKTFVKTPQNYWFTQTSHSMMRPSLWCSTVVVKMLQNRWLVQTFHCISSSFDRSSNTALLAI